MKRNEKEKRENKNEKKKWIKPFKKPNKKTGLEASRSFAKSAWEASQNRGEICSMERPIKNRRKGGGVRSFAQYPLSGVEGANMVEHDTKAYRGQLSTVWAIRWPFAASRPN